MPEKIYGGHQLTDDMTGDTETVFLVDHETQECFAYLVRYRPNVDAVSDWSVWKYDDQFSRYLVRETGRTYEACLMFLGAVSPGLRLNFEVLFSDTPMPDPYR